MTMEIQSNRWVVLLALCLSFFLVPFMAGSLNLAMPGIVDDFGMSAYYLTFLVTLYVFSTTIFQLPVARAADMFGRRRTYLAGLAVFAVSSLLCGLSWSGPSLLAFRFINGIGSAMLYTTSVTILIAVFPEEERGKALGINTAVVYCLTAASPFIGGVMAYKLGWRSIFFLCFIVGAAGWEFSRRCIKDEWCGAKGEPFDYLGSVIYALSLFGFIFGLSFLPGISSWILLGVGIVAGIVFVRISRKSQYPLLKLDLFINNRIFRLSSLAAMIHYSSSFCIGFIMGLYLQYGRGFDPMYTGILLIAQPISQALFSPLAGWLSDRVNPSILTTLGMSMTALCMFALSFLTVDSSLVIMFVILAVNGISFAVFTAPNSNVIMSSVDQADHGVASATIGTTRLIGQSISMAVMSMVVYSHMGYERLSRDNHGQLMPIVHSAFLIFAAICAAGVGVSSFKLKNGEWRNMKSARAKDLQDTP